MAAHLYWALLIRPRSGTSTAAVAEMQLRASAGGADLCTGGMPIGAHSGSTTAAQAVDDDAATIWSLDGIGSGGARLGYQFATPVTVAQAYLQLPGAGSSRPGDTYGPGHVSLQWSDDGVTWRTGSGAVDLSAIGNGEAHAWAVSDAAPGATLVGADGPVLAGTPVPGGAAVRAVGSALLHDAIDGGPDVISGYTKVDGTPPTPVQLRVRVHDARSGRVVREGWSAPNGWFEFAGLRRGEWEVYAPDHTRVYDPAGLSGVDLPP